MSQCEISQYTYKQLTSTNAQYKNTTTVAQKEKKKIASGVLNSPAFGIWSNKKIVSNYQAIPIPSFQTFCPTSTLPRTHADAAK